MPAPVQRPFLGSSWADRRGGVAYCRVEEDVGRVDRAWLGAAGPPTRAAGQHGQAQPAEPAQRLPVTPREPPRDEAAWLCHRPGEERGRLERKWGQARRRSQTYIVVVAVIIGFPARRAGEAIIIIEEEIFTARPLVSSQRRRVTAAADHQRRRRAAQGDQVHQPASGVPSGWRRPWQRQLPLERG
jgi:hypothetical protein